MDIFQCKTAMAEVSRKYDLTPVMIEEWMEEARKGMENQLRVRPKDITVQYEEKIKEMKAVIGELTLQKITLEKYNALCQKRASDTGVERNEGRWASHYDQPVMSLVRDFETEFYYKPKERKLRLDPVKVEKVRRKIEVFPTYGYRRLALLLEINKKAVQRILQLKGWQVKKRSKGHRPRAKAPSRSLFPN